MTTTTTTTTLFTIAVVLVALVTTTTATTTTTTTTGSVSFPYAVGDFVALGGSLIVVGNARRNTLELSAVARDNTTATLLVETLLSSAPQRMAFHVPSASMWVLPNAGSFVERASPLLGGAALRVPLPTSCAAVDVAAGERLVFILCSTSTGDSLLAIDVATNAVVAHTHSRSFGNSLLATARGDADVYVAQAGTSGGIACLWHQRVSWQPANSTATATACAPDVPVFTELEAQERGCANGNALAASADGVHVAFVNGGGNCAGYGICDFSGANVSLVRGAWVTGAYPSGAAFSADSQLFASTNSARLFVFGTRRHMLATSVAMTPTMTFVRRVHFATDARRVYVLRTDSYDASSAQLFWLDVDVDGDGDGDGDGDVDGDGDDEMGARAWRASRIVV